MLLTLGLLLAMLMVLAACNAGGGTEPGAIEETTASGAAPEETPEVEPTVAPEDTSIDNYDELAEALRAEGLEVEPAGAIQDPFFDVETQALMVGENMIQVFQFGDAAAAEGAGGTINAGGTIIGTTTVDWVEPPHFYREGRLLVLYAGSDETVLAALEQVLGEPFVTGQTMGSLSGDDEAGEQTVTDLASFLQALQDAGLAAEPAETLSQPFFEPEAQVVEVNEQQLQVFEFANEGAAEEAAATVSPDGSSVGTTMLTWIDTPHFYQAGKLILLYVGSDAELLPVLESILGAPFAGGE
jgi:hypothetical protein